MSIVQAKRFTVDEYHRLIELGFFHEDEHIQYNQGKSSYANKRICLPNQVVSLPAFPDLFLDLKRVFPPRLKPYIFIDFEISNLVNLWIFV
jgi:hypothetical protein